MEKKMNARKKAQRAARLRKQRNRRIALTLCLMFVVAFASIGGTIAWLTAQTSEVKNTFTTAGIEITLSETMNTDSDNDGKNDKWEAQLVPGKEYAKNPVVAVDGTVTNVDVYLFVKFEETKNPSDYLTYTSTLTEANGWKLVDDQTNVWYREVKATDTVKSWELLEGNKVTVKNTLTEAETDDTGIEMTYTAYAIQSANTGSAAEAWAKISA